MDTNTSATTSDEGKGGTADAGSSSDEQTVSRSELTKVIKERDAAKTRERGLEQKLTELQTQVESLTKKGGRSKDEEATVDSLKHQLDGTQKERDDFRKRYQDSVIERQLWPLANEHIRAGDADLFIELNRDKFEVYTDVLDGTPKVRVKGSGQTLKEFVEGFCNDRPSWAANKRAKGSDAQGPSDSKAEPGMPQDFASWGIDRQAEWMKKNPEQAKKMFGKG
jgi:hypothetical protein